jgi:Domain of unknown function (DUF4404)
MAVQETLQEAKKKIESADSISPEKKTELLNLISTLQNEIEGFEDTHPRLVEIVNAIAVSLSNMGI